MRGNPAILLAGTLFLGLALTGCSKQKEASVAPPAAMADETPQSRDLQASVDAYIKIYNRKPASLEQMVKEGFLASLPAAPPGKRYAFDPATARVSVVPK